MSYLELTNIRCFRKFRLPLERGLTLLRGVGKGRMTSGIGKSTCLMAFEWLLYGGREPLANHDAPPGSTVSVEWVHGGNSVPPVESKELTPVCGLRIYRQKSPTALLRVTTPTLDLTDVPAQAYIESLFGTYTFWVSSSYIGQDERCPLLTGTGVERLALLNEIAFKQEDPEEKIKMIDSMIMELKRGYENLAATWGAENTRCGNEIRQYGVQADWGLPNCQQVKERHSYLTSHYQSLHSRWLESNRVLSQIDALQTRLTAIGKTLEGLPVARLSANEIKVQLGELQELNILQPMIANYESLKESVRKNKEDGLYQSQAINDGDIQRAEQRESQLRTNTKVLQEWKLSNCEAATKRKAEINNLLGQSQFIEMYRFRDRLDNDLKQSIIKLTRRVSDAQLRVGEDEFRSLTCPCCQAALQLRDGKLVTTIRKWSLEEITKLRQDHAFTKQIENLERQLESYSRLPPRPTVEINVTALRQELQSLQAVAEVPPYEGPDSQQLKAIHRAQQQSNNLADLIKAYPKIETTSRLPQVEIETKINNCHQQLVNAQQREFHQREFDNLVKSIADLQRGHQPVTEQQVNDWKAEQEELAVKIKKHETFTYYQQWIDAIQRKHQELLEKQKELALWQELKVKAIEIEYRLLSEVAGDINKRMEEYLNPMFQGQLQAFLSTSRELKDGRQKPQVNMQIIKDGKSMQFKSLSGGQKDRLSLAITLAISQMQQFPYLLLDESIDSLDADLREVCLRQIRKVIGNSKGSILVNVSDYDNTGPYDHSVAIG